MAYDPLSIFYGIARGILFHVFPRIWNALRNVLLLSIKDIHRPKFECSSVEDV